MNVVLKYSRKEINQYLKHHHYFMRTYIKYEDGIWAYVQHRRGVEWEVNIDKCQTLEDLVYAIDTTIDGWHTTWEINEQWGYNLDA